MLTEQQLKTLRSSLAETLDSVDQMLTEFEPQPEAVEQPSIDDVRRALASLGLERGRDAVMDLLAQYNADKVSKVEPYAYASLIERAQELIG